MRFLLWHTKNAQQVCEKLKTDENFGLTQDKVQDRQERFGENTIKTAKNKSIVARFFAQFNDFLIILLLIAATVSTAVSIISGENDFVDPVVIMMIVVINATVGVAQESKAQKALDRLKRMSSPSVAVMRDGTLVKIPPEQLVPGDIIKLSTGDIVPADCRLISTVGLKAEESALTGESEQVLKNADFLAPEKCDLADRQNMLFSSTAIVAGSCTAVVCEIGMSTQIGAVAKLLGKTENDETPLQKRLSQMGKALGICAIVICVVIFILGLIRGESLLSTFMLSVSLAVAAIPEGLPAIVTAALALGVRVLARENAVIRRLPAVETLGCATVICSDKTGTITQNKMVVREIVGEKTEVLSLAVLCSNATASRENGVMTAVGDATETAIVVSALENGIIKSVLEKEFPRIKELPFDPVRKFMTTVHKTQTGYKIITKGAFDLLINRCNISPAELQKWTNECDKLTNSALRVIAVAEREVSVLPSENSLENNLNLVGLIGICDPPRPEAVSSVAECKKAGIRVVMITGDHKSTACAIAKQVGIITSDEHALTGAEIDKMTDRKLRSAVKNCCVYARATPLHKVRIVKALKSLGEVVAMTGDGINDAPALKSADIGCAMGKSGTQVAKDASDLVLLDDNFATIVKAVKHGRGIYENIKKSVRFLISCNIGEILAVLVCTLLSFPTPLLPIQLLWVNLITDSLPAIALGFEPIDRDIMKRRPKRKNSAMFSKSECADILLEGTIIGVITVLAFGIGRTFFDVTGQPLTARTMAFFVLSLSQLFHAFDIRSERSIFEIGLFSNHKMCLAFPICVVLQVSTVALPLMSNIFHTVPLPFSAWAVVVSLSLLPMIVSEFIKG